MTAYPQGIEPVAWLYGQVSVQSVYPGYRLISLDGATRTLTSGAITLDAWDFLTALDTAMSPSNWDVNVSGSAFTLGRSGVSRTVLWPDRLGWLLGFDTEPGESEQPAEVILPRAPSPLMVPLLSVDPLPVVREQERRSMRRRLGQGGGFAFGDAETHRFRVLLDRVGVQALDAGWVFCGEVVLSGNTLAEHLAGTAVPFSGSEPLGYRRGRVLSLDGGTWRDKAGPHDQFEAFLTLALEPVDG